MNRSRKQMTLLAMLAACLLVVGVIWYLLTFRLTALMALRWFVRQTEIPVEIHSASWNATWRDVLGFLKFGNGRVNSLSFSAKHQTLPLHINISSSVRFQKQGNQWTIELDPSLRINNLPEVTGSIETHLINGSHFDVKFEFKTKISETVNGVNIKSDQAAMTGQLKVDTEGKSTVITGTVSAEAANPAFERSPTQAMQLARLKLESKQLRVAISERNVTIETTATAKASGVQALWSTHFFEAPAVAAESPLHIALDNNAISELKLTGLRLKEPYSVSGDVVWKPGANVQANLKGQAQLETVLTDLKEWFGPEAPALQDASAKGLVRIEARSSKSHFNAKLSAIANDVSIPALRLKAQNLWVDLPSAGRGNIKGEGLSIGPATTPAVSITIDSTPDEIVIRSKNENVNLGVFGQTLVVSQPRFVLNRTAEGIKLASGKLSLKTQPIALAELQKAFCILPDQLINGSIEVNYPHVEFSPDGIVARGKTTGQAFEGRILIEDLVIQNAQPPTRVNVSASIEDMNLKEISHWLEFGKVTGRLDILFNDAEVALLNQGPFPVKYDFTIRGSSAEKRRLNFSAKALDNLMELMGVKEAASNPIAKVAFSVWRFFGTTFGFLNNIDYFGFRAKTVGGYTSLTTFDPEGSDEHYLINGTSFKMPLKSTSGDTLIYPLVMRTDDFQSWLRARINWFSSQNKETAHGQSSDCTSVW